MILNPKMRERETMKTSKSDSDQSELLNMMLQTLEAINARVSAAEKTIMDRQNAMSGKPYSEKADDDEQEEGDE